VKARNRVRRTKIQREAEGYLELGLPRSCLGALARLGDPTGYDSYTMYLWGEALRELERYDEAIVPLRQATKTDPENTRVWVALGWCYKRTGRLDLAIQSLEKALAVDPVEPLLHYNLACYWSLAGNKPLSLRHLAKALVIDPTYRQLVDDESDFDFLRDDPDFQSLRSQDEGVKP
jgi:Flp pilus assembly protein TadD